MQSLQKQYTELHRKDDIWFVTNIPKGKFVEMAGDLAWKRGEAIRSLLASASDISADTKLIWNNFSNFGATLFIGEEGGRATTIARTTSKDEAGLVAHKEMAFVPKELAIKYARTGGMLKMLCWRSDLGISIAAIEWPEKFITAALYHEMFHGLRHPIGSNEWFSPGSAEYASEEMEAHRIESSVLNQLTKQEYSKRFDEIIARSGSNVKDAVAAISIEDMTAFDRMLEMESSGLVPAGLASGAHPINLAVYMFEKRSASKSERIAFFEWLGTTGAITN